MAKLTVRNAAVVAAMGFLVIAVFQVALALGAPLGRAAWGGAYGGQLPIGLRIASGVSGAIWLLAALIVLGRAGLQVVSLSHSVLKWGIWVLVGLSFVGAAMNMASPGGWERYGWGPAALILGILCFLVARSEPVSSGG